jgi:hypothetical protein
MALKWKMSDKWRIFNDGFSSKNFSIESAGKVVSFI